MDLPTQARSDEFPFGLQGAFDRLAKWFPYTGPGNWPDADMLPEGWLGPNPGWGEARQSRVTQDEQRTEFTLWAVARSPLILGGNLTRLDAFTRSLITNQTFSSWTRTPATAAPSMPSTLGPGFENIRVWRATINEPGARRLRRVLCLLQSRRNPCHGAHYLEAAWPG